VKDIKELETFLLGLMKGKFTSLNIQYNQNTANYVSVKEYVEEYQPDWYKGCWVSPEEEQKAKDTDSLWEIQVYPLTPIGFYNYAASSLEALVEHLVKEGEGL
jgi:hypothetical protein